MEFEKVRDVISDLMNIPAENITMETNFTKDLGADSIDIFQITSELEEIFGLEFSFEDAEKIQTVANAVDYIKEAIK